MASLQTQAPYANKHFKRGRVGFPFTKEERLLACELFRRKWLVREIADRLRRSPDGVRKILKQHGFKTPNPNAKLTDDQKVEIVLKARSGRTCYQLGDEYGVDATAIRSILQVRGIDPAQRVYSTVLTRTMLEDIIAHVENGAGLTETYSRHVSSATFYRWLKDGAGQGRKEWGELRHRLYFAMGRITARSRGQRQYAVNHHFFERIDTQTKAYILGLIATDGNVRKQGLKIKLARRDRAILERVAHEMGSDAPIYDRAAEKPRWYKGRFIKGGPSSSLSIGSEKIVADLARHGLHPRKTFTVEPWTGPAKLLSSYWRGVIDGDGSICPQGRRRKRDGSRKLAIVLVGNRFMVEGFSEYVRRLTGKRAAIYPHGKIFQAVVSTIREARLVAKRLYFGAKIALERKRLLALKAIKVQQFVFIRTQPTLQELELLHAKLGTWKKVAQRLRVPPGTASVWAWRLRMTGS